MVLQRVPNGSKRVQKMKRIKRILTQEESNNKQILLKRRLKNKKITGKERKRTIDNWQITNDPHRKEQVKEWIDANRESIRERMRIYMPLYIARNREKINLINKKCWKKQRKRYIEKLKEEEKQFYLNNSQFKNPKKTRYKKTVGVQW